MDGDRYQRMRDIFHDACELEGAARRRYLDNACAADPALRREIDDLFSAESDSDDQRLVTPAMSASLLTELDPDLPTPPAALPESIGGYRVVRKLGEGGMGIVFCAEQDYPRRTVALKVLRGRASSPQGLRRFRREADLLARLRHPGIAQMYEAGIADVRMRAGAIEAQPFFAMELVEGEPLGVFAARSGLSVSARLELMATICDAVQHAHERGVIHRDLKPANILVDGAGTPRVLDFGVACARDSDAAHVTAQTQVGQLIGTIAYMSPEQLTGDPTQVDTRTDIYSCGVMLYELLAGTLPHDVHTGTLPEIIRRIIEQEPVPLRRHEPDLHGDIEAIVAKALEKDRTRRYASAAALAEDLRRHLRHEPILARPITATYLLSKFVRRHRAALAGATLALLAVIGGLTYGLVTSRQQRDLARQAESVANVERGKATAQARTAEAVVEFLTDDLLAAASPDNTSDPDIRLRDALYVAANRIDGRFPDEPLVEAQIRVVLSATLVKLGDFEAADVQLQRGAELERAHRAANDPIRMGVELRVIELAYQRGDYARALTLCTELHAQALAHLGADSETTASVAGSLGFLYLQTGNASAAEPLLIDSLRWQRARPGDGKSFVPALINLALFYLNQHRFDAAEPLLREAVEFGTQRFGRDYPDVLLAAGSLAALFNSTQRYHAAIPLLLETLESQTRVLGPTHPQTLLTCSNLGFSYSRLCDVDEAERCFERVLAARERTLGENHPHTIAAILNLGLLRLDQERLDDADALLIWGEALSHAVLGAANRRTHDFVKALVGRCEQRGEVESAEFWRHKLSAAPAAPAAPP